MLKKGTIDLLYMCLCLCRTVYAYIVSINLEYYKQWIRSVRPVSQNMNIDVLMWKLKRKRHNKFWKNFGRHHTAMIVFFFLHNANNNWAKQLMVCVRILPIIEVNHNTEVTLWRQNEHGVRAELSGREPGSQRVHQVCRGSLCVRFHLIRSHVLFISS